MTGDRSPLHTIVWACDARPDDGREFEYVRDLCRSHRGLLWIVHVAESMLSGRSGASDPDAGGEQGIVRLKSRTRSLRDEGIDASLHVVRGVTGAPATAIAQVVHQLCGDLLVIGAGRRDASGRSAPGATALQLLATVGCPVLSLGERVGEPTSGEPRPR